MESFLDEIESLEAILLDDVTIHKNPQTNMPEMIETTIFPVVGGDTDRQYICVTLQVIPTIGYPEVSPEFRLVKPRGLDDQRLNEIKTACLEKLNEALGYPVVFDLIEVIREHLTDSNLPSGQCVICLYGFQDGDQFTKTECFHYLHSFCLSRHLYASKRNWQEEQDKLPAWLKKIAEPFQAVCPVCREVIHDDADNLKEALPPNELENAPEFQLTDDLKKLQMKMSNLFLLQKSRGAIIEVGENEANVISIEPEGERQANQRKNLASESNETRENGDYSNSVVPNAHSATNRQNNNRFNQNRNQQQQQQSNNACASASSSRVTVNHTNFTPIVNNAPRYTTEPTNNNYNHHQHYNRRHYRGNNRRHHHNKEQRDQYSSQGQQQQQQQQQEQEAQSSNDTNVTGNTRTNSGKNHQKAANTYHGSSGSNKR